MASQIRRSVTARQWQTYTGLPGGQGLVGGGAGRADDGGHPAGRQTQGCLQRDATGGRQAVADAQDLAVGALIIDNDPHPADPAQAGLGGGLWSTNHDL